MKPSSHNLAATTRPRQCVAPSRGPLRSHLLWPSEPTTRIVHQTPQPKAPNSKLCRFPAPQNRRANYP